MHIKDLEKGSYQQKRKTEVISPQYSPQIAVKSKSPPLRVQKEENKFTPGAMSTSTKTMNKYTPVTHKGYGSPLKYNQKFGTKNKLQLYMQDHHERIKAKEKRK